MTSLTDRWSSTTLTRTDSPHYCNPLAFVDLLAQQIQVALAATNTTLRDSLQSPSIMIGDTGKLL